MCFLFINPTVTESLGTDADGFSAHKMLHLLLQDADPTGGNWQVTHMSSNGQKIEGLTISSRYITPSPTVIWLVPSAPCCILSPFQNNQRERKKNYSNLNRKLPLKKTRFQRKWTILIRVCSPHRQRLSSPLRFRNSQQLVIFLIPFLKWYKIWAICTCVSTGYLEYFSFETQ